MTINFQKVSRSEQQNVFITHKYICSAVLENVLAGVRSIGGVNPGRNSSFRRFKLLKIKINLELEQTGKNRPHLRNEPLRRVETQDGDRFARFEAELDESLGGDVGVVVVLFVRPLFPLNPNMCESNGHVLT